MKKVVTLMLCFTMIFTMLGMTETVYAADTVINQDTTADGDGYKPAQATVTASVSTTYVVTIPKNITMAVSEEGVGSGTFNINVKGNIAGSQKIEVLVNKSFSLTQTGKTDINTSITFADTVMQEYDSDPGVVGNESWKGLLADADIKESGKTLTGNLAATGITGGSWNGSISIKIKLN